MNITQTSVNKDYFKSLLLNIFCTGNAMLLVQLFSDVPVLYWKVHLKTRYQEFQTSRRDQLLHEC